jgi:hypothetical protein
MCTGCESDIMTALSPLGFSNGTMNTGNDTRIVLANQLPGLVREQLWLGMEGQQTHLEQRR